MRFVLRSTTANGVALYFGEAGPTIARANAVEYGDAELEQRRANAAFVFDLNVEAVEVRSEGDLARAKPSTPRR